MKIFSTLLILISPLQAITWSSQNFQTLNDTAAINPADSTILSDGTQLSIFVSTRSVPEGLERGVFIGFRSPDGRNVRVGTGVPLGISASNLNYTVRAASNGGRSWIAWRNDNPIEIRVAEVTSQSSGVPNDSIKVPGSDGWSTSFDLAVGADGLPRVAGILGVFQSADPIKIVRLDSLSPAGLPTFTAYTPTFAGGSEFSNVAIGAGANSLHLAVTRKTGNEISYLHIPASDLPPGLTLGSSEIISTNAAVGANASATRKRLTVSPLGIPSLIFRDTIANRGKLARFSAASGWSVTELPSVAGSVPTGDYLDIACASSGTLHMVWSSQGGGILSYGSTPNSNGSITAENLSPNGSNSHVSLDLSPEQEPCIVIPFSVTEGISKYNIQSLYPIDITDLDGDGFTFIEEEARLDRRIQSTFPPGPRFTVETSGSHEFPYITFETVTGGQTIGNAGYYTSNLLYEVQRSTDLNTWTSAGIILEDTFGINGRRITQYRTSTPLSDSSKQFLRVSVRRP